MILGLFTGHIPANWWLVKKGVEEGMQYYHADTTVAKHSQVK